MKTAVPGTRVAEPAADLTKTCTGMAASRTPAPNAARLQSLLTHAVFGLGLYLGGWVSHGLLN